MKRARHPIFLFALAAALTCPAFAQSPAASVSGAVTDSSGAVIAGVSLTIRNPATNIERATRTNAAGIFRISGLPAGAYELEAAKAQFSTVRRGGILLRVGDEVRLNFTLAVGESRETVEVTDTAPLTQTEGATASTVVSNRAIQEMPLNGRQLQNLALLIPGVSGGWNLSTAANRYGKARENTEGAFNVNGARSRSNNFVLDGMPMNVRQYSVINFEPSNEAVQEFELKTSVPPAEFGRTMGGAVSIVTRAGSNRFHGSVYEFFRNDRLDANNTFNNRAGLPRGKVRQNQFGGSLGGPLWKDRHFFFVNTEFLRNLETTETRLTSVPTPDERRGIVSYTNASGAQQALDLSGRISPLSRKLLDLYPQPNAGSGGLNYNAPLAIALNDYQYHARTDHHFSERDIVTLRTSWNLNDQEYIINRFGGPFIPGFSLPNPERTTNGTLGYFHTFSPSLMNEARLGVNRYGNDLGNGDTRDATDFGLPHGANANGIPTISFTSGTLEQLGGAGFFNREQNELTVFGSNSVSYLRGRHSVKFGGEISRFHFNTRGASNQRGTVLFDGSQNGLIPRTPANLRAAALADLLLGLPQQANIVVGQFGRGYRQLAYGLFVQDTWRTTPKLTLNWGLRYEYGAPWTEVNGKLANFVPGQGIVTPASPNYDGLYRPDRNNLSPRFGFAYDFSGGGQTVVRGGFAVLYETLLQASTVQQIENNAPFSASAVTFSPTPFARDDTPSRTLLDLRDSAQPSRSLAAVPQDLRNPYSVQYSFDLQQALGGGWVAEAGYRGTRGVRLPLNYNVNQVPLARLTGAERARIQQPIGTPAGTSAVIDPLRPFPDFVNINLFDNAGLSTFHSLQMKLERRFSAGLTLLAAYAFSKSIDNASDFASNDPSERVMDSYNLRQQRGPSSFDIPHRFTAAFTYLLPSPRGSLRPLFGGWQVNGIVTLQSGQPFTPFTSAFDPFRNENFNRLDVAGDPNSGVPAGRAYNPDAFRAPELGTFGVSGRNIARGDSFKSVDLSLYRNLAFGDRLRLQLRLEAINALNIVNYQGPVTNQTTSPGLFVATAAPRLVQLGAKVTF